MSPIFKQYVKMFLLFGIIYGCISWIMDFLVGDSTVIPVYLFSSVFFGAAMSLTLVTYQRYRLKKDGVEDLNDSNLKVNQSKKIILELSIDEIMSKLKTDSELAKMGIKKTDDEIVIKTGITWRSWGEVIRIIRNQNSNGSEYTVQSSSKVKATLIDYGKNLHNVERICKLISKV